MNREFKILQAMIDNERVVRDQHPVLSSHWREGQARVEALEDVAAAFTVEAVGDTYVTMYERNL